MPTLGIQWVLSFLDKNVYIVEVTYVDHCIGRGASGIITNNSGFEVLRLQEYINLRKYIKCGLWL